MSQQEKPSDVRQNEITASIILIAVTVAALIAANSALSSSYKAVLTYPLTIGYGDFAIQSTVKGWIKDALMAVFFLLVGLELKSEFKEGVLSNARSAALPFIGAAAGMMVPALVYLTIINGSPDLANGWAIPTATDIAFAVGIIGLLGSRVPPGLKALLLAIAVIDDLGAILIIALFYTADINVTALALALACMGVMAALNFLNVWAAAPYVVLGVIMWICLSQSGASPTLAGVATAFFVPLGDQRRSPLHDMGDALRWPVSFLIMPVFAFANAGAPLGSMGIAGFAEPLTLAVMLGLLLGKPIGITLAIFAAVRLNVSPLPNATNWGQIVGMSFVAGIGFTMSLFVGSLAFTDQELVNQARLGTLSGSLLAAICGALILWAFAFRSPGDWYRSMRPRKREIF